MLLYALSTGVCLGWYYNLSLNKRTSKHLVLQLEWISELLLPVLKCSLFMQRSCIETMLWIVFLRLISAWKLLLFLNFLKTFFYPGTGRTCLPTYLGKHNFLAQRPNRDNFFPEELNHDGKKASRVGRGDKKCFPPNIIFFYFKVQKARKCFIIISPIVALLRLRAGRPDKNEQSMRKIGLLVSQFDIPVWSF